MPVTPLPLTVKEMDEINFLLTEVSLELLGNQFFNIHGQKQNGLASLYTVGEMPATNNLNCDLIKELDMAYLVPKTSTDNDNGDFLAPNNEQPRIDSQIINESSSSSTSSSLFSKKSRRLSCSETTIPTLTTVASNDQSSDTNSAAKAATVRRRRQTSMHPSTSKKSISLNKPVQSSVQEGDNDEDESTKQQKSIVRSIKKMVELETARMIKNSDRCKEEYYLKHCHRIDGMELDENDIVDEFYEEEKINLSQETIKLMEMIKFLKSDSRNSAEMKKIAANILLVKDLI